MLSLPDAPQDAPSLVLSAMNFGVLPMITGQTRLARRFYDDDAKLTQLESVIGESLDADKAMDLGLITANPDDIDWDDEIRLALEERASMSPDALTGMEANLRFNGRENMATRVFGRLSAWQNWIFNRPNAVGESGALKVYGTGSKAKFEFDRV
jgi:benzoyl-CoA-dihydrodiol lyase